MPWTRGPIASLTSPEVSVGNIENFSQIKFDLGKLLIAMVLCQRPHLAQDQPTCLSFFAR